MPVATFFTQNPPRLRTYSCPCDEMQTIWGKLVFGCDARLHSDDEHLWMLDVQHPQETKGKTPSRVTVKDNAVAWWGKKHKSSWQYVIKEQQFKQNSLFGVLLLCESAWKSLYAHACVCVCVTKNQNWYLKIALPCLSFGRKIWASHLEKGECVTNHLD